MSWYHAWYSTGSYQNPDPHANDEYFPDQKCYEIPEIPESECISTCIFNHTFSTKAPIYSIAGNECRTETMNMYLKCFNQCRKK